MKDIRNVGYGLLCILLVFISCQREEVIIENEDTLPEELADMVMKVVTHDGSYDDIVDGANCFSINIPYTIYINNDKHTVKGEEDYLGILPSDDIRIEFPITITAHDHKEKVVQNEQELEALVLTCSADDDDIECVDFVYPFVLQTFNEFTNRFHTVQVLHDKQIFEFMEKLDEGVKVQIKYPIDLTLYNGQNMVAGHNEALMATIKGAVNVCDEEDN